jgi:hypothetical protein
VHDIKVADCHACALSHRASHDTVAAGVIKVAAAGPSLPEIFITLDKASVDLPVARHIFYH